MSDPRHIYRSNKLSNISQKRYARKYNPEYLKEKAAHGASIKLGFGDFDGDGDLDGIYPKQRAGVAEKPGLHINPPRRGPRNLRGAPSPTYGPGNIQASLIKPEAGPSSLTTLQLAPILGPFNASAELLAPAAGPSSLNAINPLPSSGPSSLSSSVIVPTQGPGSLSSSFSEPIQGPSSLSSSVIVPVIDGVLSFRLIANMRLSNSFAAPITGKMNLTVSAGQFADYTWQSNLQDASGNVIGGWKRTNGMYLNNYLDEDFIKCTNALYYVSSTTEINIGPAGRCLPEPPSGSAAEPFSSTMNWSNVILEE